MSRKCYCGTTAVISRERLRGGEWVCLVHATEDARRDAEFRDPEWWPYFGTYRNTNFFEKKYGVIPPAVVLPTTRR